MSPSGLQDTLPVPLHHFTFLPAYRQTQIRIRKKAPKAEPPKYASIDIPNLRRA